MKKKHKKRISCYGKAKHKSFFAALIANKKLNKNKNLISCIYKCKRCNFYHIGKPSYYDDPEIFWNNIFNQMSEEELKKLEEI